MYVRRWGGGGERNGDGAIVGGSVENDDGGDGLAYYKKFGCLWTVERLMIGLMEIFVVMLGMWWRMVEVWKDVGTWLGKKETGGDGSGMVDDASRRRRCDGRDHV